LITSVLNICLG